MLAYMHTYIYIIYIYICTYIYTYIYIYIDVLYRALVALFVQTVKTPSGNNP